MTTRQPAVPKQHTDALLGELRGLIDAARTHVAQTANTTLTLLYWHIGQRIQREVLKNGRADYGEEILPTLSTQLSRGHFIEILPHDAAACAGKTQRQENVKAYIAAFL